MACEFLSDLLVLAVGGVVVDGAHRVLTSPQDLAVLVPFPPPAIPDEPFSPGVAKTNLARIETHEPFRISQVGVRGAEGP
ncbi:unnamed protein product, partial [marine sediment metagenome]